MAAASLLLKSSWLLPHHLYQNISHMLVFDKNLSLSR
jgi:hypothetical protein